MSRRRRAQSSSGGGGSGHPLLKSVLEREPRDQLSGSRLRSKRRTRRAGITAIHEVDEPEPSGQLVEVIACDSRLRVGGTGSSQEQRLNML
jgi:hypothetical protein